MLMRLEVGLSLMWKMDKAGRAGGKGRKHKDHQKCKRRNMRVQEGGILGKS